jgi:hypothetical protein
MEQKGLEKVNMLLVGLVVVGGLGYGIYRIGWGDNADLWLNNNFGYNKK